MTGFYFARRQSGGNRIMSKACKSEMMNAYLHIWETTKFKTQLQWQAWTVEYTTWSSLHFTFCKPAIFQQSQSHFPSWWNLIIASRYFIYFAAFPNWPRYATTSFHNSSAWNHKSLENYLRAWAHWKFVLIIYSLGEFPEGARRCVSGI